MKGEERMVVHDLRFSAKRINDTLSYNFSISRKAPAEHNPNASAVLILSALKIAALSAELFATAVSQWPACSFLHSEISKLRIVFQSLQGMGMR